MEILSKAIIDRDIANARAWMLRREQGQKRAIKECRKYRNGFRAFFKVFFRI
jgi:hypothetical protein